MKFIAFVTTALASLTTSQSFDVVDHDHVHPFRQPEPLTLEEQIAVRYKPELHISEGCHPYAAVQADGSFSAGLTWSINLNGNCKRSPRGSQVYSRDGMYHDKYAIMYSWYFPKGKGRSNKHRHGHRHDWQFAIVWLDKMSVNESTIIGVSSSIGEIFNHEAPLDPSHIVDSSIKLDLYSTVWGSRQGLRLTRKIGEFQDLIQWTQLTEAAQLALNTVNFDTDEGESLIQVPFKDKVFQQKLEENYLF